MCSARRAVLECSDSPSRRSPLMGPQTKPVGFSNDFLVATPGHPFLGQMLAALPSWNRRFGTKYPTVMFSTGPMFVSYQVLPYYPVPAVNPLSSLRTRACSCQQDTAQLNSSSFHSSCARTTTRLVSVQVLLYEPLRN